MSDPAPTPAVEAPRPAFAASWPRTAELDALLAAFERGDYGAVRSGAPALAARAADERERAAASELTRRIGPDPLAVALLAVGAGLLLFFTYWFFTHGHAAT